MTSLIVSAFARQAESDAADKIRKIRHDSCAFCAIVEGTLPAFTAFEDDDCMAFLDILPIRDGHTLLIPKAHYARMTDLPGEISAHMAAVLPQICRAVCKATGQPDFNLVSNNGYAQVVDHVHWHIVPAPRLDERRTVSDSGTGPIGLREIARREELDDEAAERLAEAIRVALASERKEGRSKL